jgi:hypothetical protein
MALSTSIGPAIARVDVGRFAVATGLAAVAAAVANAVAFGLSSALGIFPVDFVGPPLPAPVTVANVVVDSLGGVLLGGAALAAIARFTRHPVRNFRILVLVVLAAFGVVPLAIPGAPAGFSLTLEVLHLIAGAVAVWLLPAWTSASPMVAPLPSWINRAFDADRLPRPFGSRPACDGA